MKVLWLDKQLMVTWLQKEKYYQQAKGGDPCSLVSTDEATPGGLTSSGLPGRRDLGTIATAPQRVTQMVKEGKHAMTEAPEGAQELFSLERRLRRISSTVPQKSKARVQTGQSQALSRGAQ